LCQFPSIDSLCGGVDAADDVVFEQVAISSHVDDSTYINSLSSKALFNTVACHCILRLAASCIFSCFFVVNYYYFKLFFIAVLLGIVLLSVKLRQQWRFVLVYMM